MIDPEIAVPVATKTDFEHDRIELGPDVLVDVWFENHRPSGVGSGGLAAMCGAGAIRQRVEHARWLVRKGYR